MAKAQEVYDFLIKYMDNYGGASNNWYAGITSDVEQRLFSEHGVSRQGRWAHHTADSEKGARNVEEVNWYSDCGHLEKSVIKNKLLEVSDDSKAKELYEAI